MRLDTEAQKMELIHACKESDIVLELLNIFEMLTLQNKC